MNDMKDLQDIVDKVSELDGGINGLIVPLLKDTIKDNNISSKRKDILIGLLIFGIVVIAIFSQILVAIQNQKYADFLSQFEFEETVYQETMDNSSINSGNSISK